MLRKIKKARPKERALKIKQGGKTMPQIRTIKPEFWIDKKITQLFRDARLFFIKEHYIWFKNFNRHQKIDRPLKNNLPLPIYDWEEHQIFNKEEEQCRE